MMGDMLLRLNYERLRLERSEASSWQMGDTCDGRTAARVPASEGFYCRALRRTGEAMVRWGSRLQERYGSPEVGGALVAANDGR